MLLCPRCTLELLPERGAHGQVFGCAVCRGHAATLPVLRKRLLPDVVNELWRRARAGSPRAGRPCPGCHDAMVEVAMSAPAGDVRVDACTRCQMVWFDADEFEQAPALPPPPERERLSPEAAEAWGRLVAAPRDETIESIEIGSTDFFKALIGAPTKSGEPERLTRPWVTWGLAITIVALTAIPIFRDGLFSAFFGPHEALRDLARAWGFVPTDAWRLGGLTSVTSFFLHGGWFHALWNTYFLVLTGDDLEGVLGRGRFLLLILLATVAGDQLHGALNPRSEIPCVGASGGIAGLFAYYALALPKVKLGLPFGWPYAMGRGGGGFVRVRIGVRWVFGLWFATEVLHSPWSVGRVAHGAHVGGALAGAAWWAVERQVRRAAPPP